MQKAGRRVIEWRPSAPIASRTGVVRLPERDVHAVVVSERGRDDVKQNSTEPRSAPYRQRQRRFLPGWLPLPSPAVRNRSTWSSRCYVDRILLSADFRATGW